MKKKLVLRPFVLPTLYLMLLVLLMMYTARALYSEKPKSKEQNVILNDIVDDTIAVIEEKDVFVLNPYLGEEVSEQIGYYDYQGEKDNQEKSIIQFGSTYLQNTGITYYSNEDFKVISIMDGKVTKIYDNELLGNVVEITHDNIVSVYQMLKDIKVKVGDEVPAGFEIATSGTSKLFPKGSYLHFEVLKDGKIQNPKSIIGTNTKEL